MTSRRSLLASAAALVVAGAALAPAVRRAAADVLVQLGNGDAVTGTFLPASEVETYRFTLAAGSKVSLSATGKKQRGTTPPVVHLVLRDAAHTDLTALPGVLKTLPTGGKVSNLVVASSGLHTAAVTSDATGDYAFTVKWKSPPRPPKQTVTFGAQDETQTVPFAADAGTKASFAIAAARGSGSLPRLLRVAAKDGSWTSSDFAPAPSAASKSHSARNVVLGGAGGDYVLTVAESSGTPGGATASLTLKAPKTKRRKVDLTTKQTGSNLVNNFAKGGVVGPDGGSVAVSDPFAPTPLDGAAVEIPSGSLPKPVVIVVATGDSLAPGGGQAQGPAVDFGPDGLQFKASEEGPVLVTIPFDPEPYGGDFSSLDVYVKDAKGNVSLVEPKSSYEIDAGAGTVTFPVAHFSTYQAFGPARPSRADLNGDGLDDLVVPAPHASNDIGKVLVFFGRADFATAPPAAPDRTLTGPAANLLFGLEVAVGDVNGDGIADLAVSSLATATSNAGRVDVFFGGTSFGQASSSDAHVDGTGMDPASFGFRMLIGDVTGDGKGDLVVGAPDDYTSSEFFQEGVVTVFPGGPSFTTTTSGDAAAIVLRGGEFAVGLGKSLALGRLVGDANADLVIGAVRNQDGPQLPGSVFLVPGGPELTSSAVLGVFTQFDGEANEDGFGDAVAVADVNADGAADLLVGAPGADIGGPAPLVDAGAVYAFFGPSLPGRTATINDRLSQPFAQAGERRGEAITLGQFLGSPVRDVAYSTPLRDGGPVGAPNIPDAGGVWLLTGGRGFESGLRFLTPGQPNERLGTRILPAADLDGDGRDDLAVTIPGHNGDQGEVQVYFGQGTDGPVFDFTGDVGDRLGDR